MSSQQIDLFLGSDLGLWVLENVDSKHVRHVITLEHDIASQAQELDIKVILGNANSVEFSPAEVGFSIHYPRLLKPFRIEQYHHLYNLHPAYLPWGRGYYPIFWALWEQTPAGATLHEITAGIDEGPIVAQVKVSYHPHDTGGSLFQRVREAEKALFHEYWEAIAAGVDLPSIPQKGSGSYHAKRDFFDLKQNSHWSQMNAEELMRLIRCLTFPGHTGLEVSLGDHRFHICLEALNK